MGRVTCREGSHTQHLQCPSLSDRYCWCVMTGNVYFAGVDRHPFEDDMLIALMPVNLGNADEGGNGDGESFIAMSLSCDGVHFSAMTKLVGTIGREGRTWDHPVDGILMENGTAHFLMHNNVKGIGPNAPGPARILKYRIVTEELRRISEQARRDTIGCASKASVNTAAATPPSSAAFWLPRRPYLRGRLVV